MSNDYSLKRIGVFPFQIYVFHNCAQSQLILDSVSDVITSVNQTLTEIITLPEPEVAISTFRASLETDDTSPYYEADLCGSIEVTMTLSDGSELPEFMVFDESDLTFLVEATSNDEIG